MLLPGRDGQRTSSQFWNSGIFIWMMNDKFPECVEARCDQPEHFMGQKHGRRHTIVDMEGASLVCDMRLCGLEIPSRVTRTGIGLCQSRYPQGLRKQRMSLRGAQETNNRQDFRGDGGKAEMAHRSQTSDDNCTAEGYRK